MLNKNSDRYPAIPLTADAANRIGSRATMLPAMIPLRANFLDGIKGSSTGVTNAPAKIPAARARMDAPPRCRAPVREKMPGPIPDSRNMTKVVIRE